MSRDQARRELGVSAGRKVILFFGLIKHYKGLEYLVEAFRVVRTRVEGVTLLIAGRIATEDPESGPYCEKLLGGLQGDPDVRIFPEFIPFSRIALFFTAADVVALPYVKTYQSGIIFAAYAAGKPVVVTDTGGLAETVDEGSTGSVVARRDVEALADRISAVLRLPDRGSAMGHNARQFAKARLSWASVGEQTAALYRRLLAPNGRLAADGTSSQRNDGSKSYKFSE